MLPNANPNNLNLPEYAGDDGPIDPESIWHIKGPTAPGAVDMGKREQVLQTAGVARQLVFPTSIGLYAIMMHTGTNVVGVNELFDDGTDVLGYADDLVEAYNHWTLERQREADRLVFAAILNGKTPAAVLANAEALVRGGARAVLVISSELIGGVSPAHDLLDPVWDLLARSEVSVLVHIGDQGSFLKTKEWGTAPFFEGYPKGIEFDLGPWTSSTVHLGAQNFVATMVIGGVFERHPMLRFGVTEFGAYWIGPLADMLDMWHINGGLLKKGRHTHLPLLPSDYIKRNVRVSAFDFEDVDRYIEQYDMGDVVCFASDYPHLEGGRGAMNEFARKLDRLGPEVMEKFFVSNGEWIIPKIGR